jgi:hypothetical protein
MVESRLRALVPSVQFISRLSIATLLLITPLMKLRLVTAFSPAPSARLGLPRNLLFCHAGSLLSASAAVQFLRLNID